MSQTFNKGEMRRTLFILCATFITGFKTLAYAETAVKFDDILQEVAIKGDFRLRHESFFNKTLNKEDRHRERLRLRVGVDFKLPESLEVRTRFASGTGEQVSTNQTFDNLGSQKDFWIDQAYLFWKPVDSVSLRGGRMANPLWTVYSSDIVWDADFNPEGFGEQYKFTIPIFGGIRTFFNSMQMVADEDANNSSKDQWLFSNQLGTEVLLFDQTRFTFAATLHEWSKESAPEYTAAQLAAGVANFGQVTTNTGNRRVTSGAQTNILANEFRVWELTAEYATSLIGLPLSLQGTYIKNVRSRFTPRENTGVQAGFIVGKASARHTAEFGYFYKQAATDATVADVADSDFGNGGTNRKGHILWLAYAPMQNVVVNAKYFMTKTFNGALAPGTDDINRLQVDLVTKF